MAVIEVKDLHKTYTNGNIKNHVLKGVNLEVKEKEFVAVLGKSGSGKSTLLNVIGGLEPYDSGTVRVMGESLREKSESKMAYYRCNVTGFVFQAFHLIPVMSVWENIVMPVRLNKGRVNRDYVMELVEMLGIADKINDYPSKLSGGQQQRVAVARALVNNPAIILADEPTGNLDFETGNQVMELLINSARKYGQSMLMITHDEDFAKRADRIIYLKDGMVE